MGECWRLGFVSAQSKNVADSSGYNCEVGTSVIQRIGSLYGFNSSGLSRPLFRLEEGNGVLVVVLVVDFASMLGASNGLNVRVDAPNISESWVDSIWSS